MRIWASARDPNNVVLNGRKKYRRRKWCSLRKGRRPKKENLFKVRILGYESRCTPTRKRTREKTIVLKKTKDLQEGGSHKNQHQTQLPRERAFWGRGGDSKDRPGIEPRYLQ